MNVLKWMGGTSSASAQGTGEVPAENSSGNPGAAATTNAGVLSSSAPREWWDDGGRYYGMENYGNTCYINSIVQALYYCRPFRDSLLAHLPPIPPLDKHLSPPLGISPHSPRSLKPSSPSRIRDPRAVAASASSAAKDAAASRRPSSPVVLSLPSASSHSLSSHQQPSLLTALSELFYTISSASSPTGTISLRSFVDQVKKAYVIFNSTTHQDAHEFLNYLLNTIAEESQSVNHSSVIDKDPSATRTTWVRELFEGILTSETKCLSCERTTSMDDIFLDLSIDIEMNTSITSCLRQFSASEMLRSGNKFSCDSCCGLQEAEKRMKIKRLPRLLTLHLKRFKHTQDGREIKLNHRVVFPRQLRLFNVTDDCEDSDRLYNLKAVVIHIGTSVQHGHFITIVQSSPDRWLLYNDEKITPVDASELEKYFGDSPEVGSGYVLFFQAAEDMSPPPPKDNTNGVVETCTDPKPNEDAIISDDPSEREVLLDSSADGSVAARSSDAVVANSQNNTREDLQPLHLSLPETTSEPPPTSSSTSNNNDHVPPSTPQPPPSAPPTVPSSRRPSFLPSLRPSTAQTSEHNPQIKPLEFPEKKSSFSSRSKRPATSAGHAETKTKDSSSSSGGGWMSTFRARSIREKHKDKSKHNNNNNNNTNNNNHGKNSSKSQAPLPNENVLSKISKAAAAASSTDRLHRAINGDVDGSLSSATSAEMGDSKANISSPDSASFLGYYSESNNNNQTTTLKVERKNAKYQLSDGQMSNEELEVSNSISKNGTSGRAPMSMLSSMSNLSLGDTNNTTTQSSLVDGGGSENFTNHHYKSAPGLHGASSDTQTVLSASSLSSVPSQINNSATKEVKRNKSSRFSLRKNKDRSSISVPSAAADHATNSSSISNSVEYVNGGQASRSSQHHHQYPQDLSASPSSTHFSSQPALPPTAAPPSRPPPTPLSYNGINSQRPVTATATATATANANASNTDNGSINISQRRRSSLRSNRSPAMLAPRLETIQSRPVTDLPDGDEKTRKSPSTSTPTPTKHSSFDPTSGGGVETKLKKNRDRPKRLSFRSSK